MLRAAVGAGRAANTLVRNTDDDHDEGILVYYGIDMTAARGWLPPRWRQDGVTFKLESAEAEYLRERIITSTAGSLYEWFLTNRVAPAGVRYVWDHDDADHFPDQLRVTIGHAERFHYLIQGAALLYNLYVSRLVDNDDLTTSYELLFEEWDNSIRDGGVLGDWSMDQFISTLRQLNPRLRAETAEFVRQWAKLVRQPDGGARDMAMEELIKKREWQTKRARARLFNPAARDEWRGDAGLVPLDYNWGVAARIIGDIQAAMN